MKIFIWKLAAWISLILLIAAGVIYFSGPKTSYSVPMKLLYNTKYLFTFCPSKTSSYSGELVRFSYLVYGSDSPEVETDNNSVTRIWTPNGPVVTVSRSLPEKYKRALAGSHASERIPNDIKAKIVKEGMTLDTAPWVIAETFSPYYEKTSMLLQNTITRVTLKNGLPAVSFIIRGDPMAGGGYSKYLFVWGPEKQFCGISTRAPDQDYTLTLLETLYSRRTTIPIKFPAADTDKHCECQTDELLNTLEF